MPHKDLYKHCKPVLVNRILEDFLIECVLSGSQISDNYEKKIDMTVVPPIQKWSGYLSDLGFTCTNQYEQIFSFWYVSFDYPASWTRHATVNVVYNNDFRNGKISHIMTCVYQGIESKVLVGNVEELYEKVSENLQLVVDISKMLGEEKSLEICKDNKYDRKKSMSVLVSLAKKKKIKWDSIEDILPEDMKRENRSKINSEKFNL